MRCLAGLCVLMVLGLALAAEPARSATCKGYLLGKATPATGKPADAGFALDVEGRHIRLVPQEGGYDLASLVFFLGENSFIEVSGAMSAAPKGAQTLEVHEVRVRGHVVPQDLTSAPANVSRLLKSAEMATRQNEYIAMTPSATMLDCTVAPQGYIVVRFEKPGGIFVYRYDLLTAELDLISSPQWSFSRTRTHRP